MSGARKIAGEMSILKTEPPLQAGTPDTAPPPSRQRFGWYLFLLLLIPAIFFPLPFWIATLPSYEHWSTSQWTPMLEYAYDVHTPPGQSADVVIFGDSSAFIGIDPKILNRKLGIRSLILPDSIGSIPVTGDGPLRSYLKHNPPPRLLVLYFSPWNLDFAHIPKFRLFEGEEMLLRHGTAREVAAFTLHHPTEMLQFPFRLYSTFGPKMLHAAIHHVNREQGTADALGHADYNEARPPLTASCTIPAEYLSQTGTASVRELVQRYSTAQTRVVVYIAPVPDCRDSAEATERSYALLNAAPPRALPAKDFVGDVDYAHMQPAAVPAATDVFAKALKERGALQGLTVRP